MNKSVEYLCCVYDICFEVKPSIQPNHLALPQNQFNDPVSFPRYNQHYHMPIGDFNSFLTAGATITTKQPAADSLDRSLKLPAGDDSDDHTSKLVVPQTCRSGDWSMRYSEHETNFHPWSIDAKFSHFELVPWRQQKSRVDLVNDEGCERTELSAESQENLRRLQKFEIKRWKRLHRQREKLDRLRAKRHIKIKFIVSLELRNQRLKMFSPKVETRKFIYKNQHVFVFNNRCFNLDEHWGYFSQRNKGVEETLVNGQHLRMLADHRGLTHFNNGNNVDYRIGSELKRISNGEQAFQEVPCDKCRDRWVHICITANE